MLPIRTIIVPTDFSKNSDYAFRIACSLARDYGAKIVAIHVATPPIAMYGEGIVAPPIQDATLDELRAKLEQIQPSVAGVPIEHLLVEGEPADQILRAAESIHGDVIVIGTHGRTGLARLLMGSVAEQVVRKATCPVLAIRMPTPTEKSPKASSRQTVGSVAG